jgi:hypothetical protein
MKVFAFVLQPEYRWSRKVIGRCDDGAGGAAKGLLAALNVISRYIVSISESLNLSSLPETHRFQNVSDGAKP